MRVILCLLAILLLGASRVFNQQNMAINGIIKMEKEELKEVEIELYDLYGQLIDRSSPTDEGYYLMPILDKDNYVLKMKQKEGYTFNPSEIRINLKERVNDDWHCNCYEFNVDLCFILAIEED